MFIFHWFNRIFLSLLLCGGVSLCFTQRRSTSIQWTSARFISVCISFLAVRQTTHENILYFTIQVLHPQHIYYFYSALENQYSYTWQIFRLIYLSSREKWTKVGVLVHVRIMDHKIFATQFIYIFRENILITTLYNVFIFKMETKCYIL